MLNVLKYDLIKILQEPFTYHEVLEELKPLVQHEAEDLMRSAKSIIP